MSTPPTGRNGRIAALAAAFRAAPRRPLATAAAAALFSLLAYAVVRHLAGTSMIDMLVYRAEGRAVVAGGDLYGFRISEWALPATYPPFAAMLFVPAAWIGVGPLRVLITAANILLLATLAWQSFRLADWPRRELRPVAVVLAAGFGVWLEPVFTTLRYGQVNLALACLILGDLLRPDSRRTKGLGIGIAAGIKLTPGLFAVYLLLTGRVRAALTAGAGFLATAALGWTVLPSASRDFWTRYVFDSSRVGKTWIVDNQSLRGTVERLLHTTHSAHLVPLLAILVAVAGLAVATLYSRSAGRLPRAEAWAVVCTALTGLLISPISWTHHWVWCVPLLVLLAAEADRERSRPPAVRKLRWRPVLAATALALCSFGMWLVPHKGNLDLHVPAWQQPQAGIYTLLGLAVLALAALRLWRRRDAVGRSSLPAQRPQRGGSPQQAPATR